MRKSPLHYERVGSGEPLVLIHAAVADARMWDAQIAPFAQRYQVIRYDAQGFGQSPAAVEPATRAEDLYELLRTLGSAPRSSTRWSWSSSAPILCNQQRQHLAVQVAVDREQGAIDAGVGQHF